MSVVVSSVWNTIGCNKSVRVAPRDKLPSWSSNKYPVSPSDKLSKSACVVNAVFPEVTVIVLSSSELGESNV